ISPAQTHPQFRTKPVCHLACRHCHRLVSNRAMKAVLLADTRVELFSTDLPLKGAVALVNDTYVTVNCKCHIRDIACLGCGNCIGYHVTQPCTSCTAACNNGQRTMLTDAVSVDRKHPSTGADVVWGQL
ncbi:protein FAM72, partial [Catenaria anguillulae PL171]